MTLDSKIATTGLTEEKGYLVEYNKKHRGKLIATPSIEKCGWKVYYKDGTFAGILDEEKIAVWHVEEDSLIEIASER